LALKVSKQEYTKKIMKVIIVGGVAGGASCAARLRRLDEKAEIIMVEKGPYVSYANADSDTVAKARELNGWKNSGCPWTKKLTPERLVLPKPQ